MSATKNQFLQLTTLDAFRGYGEAHPDITVNASDISSIERNKLPAQHRIMKGPDGKDYLFEPTVIIFKSERGSMKIAESREWLNYKLGLDLNPGRRYITGSECDKWGHAIPQERLSAQAHVV